MSTLVAAHRGGAILWPENSPTAFRQAAASNSIIVLWWTSFACNSYLVTTVHVRAIDCIFYPDTTTCI